MKRIKEIIIGEKRGMLTVLYEAEKQKGFRFLKVKCDCGEIKEIKMYGFYNNRNLSCGCNRNTHKKKHGLSYSRQYKIYTQMKQRCYNTKSTNYEHYGLRGITICDEWLGEKGFINFYNWAMGNGYSDDLTIDRIDNDNGYSPDNCRWVAIQMQVINQRMQSNNTSGYRGIGYDKKLEKWRAIININKGKIHLGYFTDLKDAVNKRNDYIIANNLPNKTQEFLAIK